MSDKAWVTGEFVETVQLQVVCQTLINKLSGNATEITREHLETYGNIDTALQVFYEDSIKEAIEKSKDVEHFNEKGVIEKGVKEGFIRTWFEKKLITPAETRGLAYRGDTHTEGLINEAVDVLDRAHIIREERRGSGRWYELSHDRFIYPIKEANKNWLLQYSSAAETRQWLEKRAAHWEMTQSDEDLLDESQLPVAERWMISPEAAELSYDPAIARLVQASRTNIRSKENQRQFELESARNEARSARRFRRLTFVLAIVSLLALASAGYAWLQRGEAARNRSMAETERTRAEELKGEAYLAKNAAKNFKEQGELLKKENEQARIAITVERNKSETLIQISNLRKAEADSAIKLAHQKMAEAKAAQIISANEQAIRKTSNNAKDLYMEGNKEGAIEEYKTTLDKFSPEDLLGKANMLTNIAEISKETIVGEAEHDPADDYDELAREAIARGGESRQEAESERNKTKKRARKSLAETETSLNEASNLYGKKEDYAHQAVTLRTLGELFEEDTLKWLYEEDEDKGKAVQYYDDALQLYKTKVDKPSLKIAILEKLGELTLKVDTKRAADYYEQLRSAYNESRKPGEAAGAAVTLGSLYVEIKEKTKALAAYEYALAYYRDRENPPLTASDKRTKAFITFQLALAYNVFGDKEIALEKYRQALAIYEMPAPDLPDATIGGKASKAAVLLEIGKLSYELGKKTEALDSYEKAAKLYAELGGSGTIASKRRNARATANAYERLGAIYFKDEKPKAIVALTEAAKFYAIGGDHQQAVEILDMLSQIYASMGDNQNADEFKRKAKEIEDRIKVEPKP